MIIKLFQIKDSKLETCNYLFGSYDRAKEFGFTMDDYEEVYSYILYKKVGLDNDYSVVISEKEKKSLLDDIYEKFNIRTPEDFKGHSLSVSDVVALGDELYYCDSFGWKKLKEKR